MPAATDVLAAIGVNWLRSLGVIGLLLIAQCKADACGGHVELKGPSLHTEARLRTRSAGPALPTSKADYVGVWRGGPIWLAIRGDATVVYYRNDGSGPVSIESSIQELRADGFSVGMAPVLTFFHVEKPPHLEGSDWRMTVDGIELRKTPDYAVLAREYTEEDSPHKDDTQAALLLSKGCDNDDMTCCVLLGSFYEHGLGVTRDLQRAAALMTKACAREQLLGCAMLGGYYAEGRGVPKDFAKSEQLVTKACEAGEALGCHNLGVMYDEGQGVPIDDVRAAGLYQRACDRGSPSACQNLALMCEDGEGVTKDLARATELYRRACELGLSDSCRYLRQP